jgi:hypothetical protein
MSAPTTAATPIVDSVRREITGKYPLARVLHLILSYGALTAYITAAPPRSKKWLAGNILAWTVADLDQCHIESEHGRCVLWLGRTSFELTHAEAKQIAIDFGIPVRP